MRHAAQHAVEPIGPAVVLAHQHVRVAVLHGEGPTAVPTHVEERAQRPVLPPHHDDRLSRDLGDHMVARLRELMAVGYVLPRGREDRVAIERVEPRVRVPRRRDGLRACERADPQIDRLERGEGAVLRHYGPSRLYLRSTARSRSCGSAYTVRSSAPIMVRAASMALTIASSVTCTVASNSGVICSFDTIETCASPESREARALAVENAMKMSPDELDATPPSLPTPSAARRAMRFSWWGRSGASVATTMMIEPTSGGMPAASPERGPLQGARHGTRSEISWPTGTPAIRR